MSREKTLRHHIVTLSEREIDHTTLAAEALGLLRGYLETRMLLWLTLDPVTLLPTSLHLPSFLNGLPGFVRTRFFFKRFVSSELDSDDVLSLSWMMQHGARCGSVHQLTNGALNECARFAQVLSRWGVKDELRVLLEDGGQVWGMIAACRRSRAFSTDEQEVISDLGPILGGALRQALLRAAIETDLAEDRPGLILFNDAGEIEHISEEARALLGDDERERHEGYWLSLIERHEQSGGGASVHVMTPGGAVTLHRSRLGGHAALIVERSRPNVLAELLIKAYGLSPRESEVVAALCRGWTTRKIAFELDISDYTVQDHLKSIFDKVGVRSRKELVSHLLHEHYLPRHRRGATPSPRGWYLGT